MTTKSDKRFPGLHEKTRQLLKQHCRDWSGLGVDPDAELLAARERYPDLRVGAKYLKVTSPEIVIRDGNAEYPMGRYAISVDLSNPEGWLIGHAANVSSNILRAAGTVRGTTGSENLCHPHICVSGVGCWGQLSVPFMRACSEGRWVDALDLVCTMLQSCDMSHRGLIRNYWKHVRRPRSVDT